MKQSSFFNEMRIKNVYMNKLHRRIKARQDSNQLIQKRTSFEQIYDQLTESEKQLLHETTDILQPNPENKRPQAQNNQVSPQQFKHLLTVEQSSFNEEDMTKIVDYSYYIKEEQESRRNEEKQQQDHFSSDPLQKQLYEQYGIKYIPNYKNSYYTSPQKNMAIKQINKSQINNIRQIYKENPQKYFDKLQKEFIDHLTPRKQQMYLAQLDQKKTKTKTLETSLQEKPPRPLHHQGFHGYKVQREQSNQDKVSDYNSTQQRGLYQQTKPKGLPPQDQAAFYSNQKIRNQNSVSNQPRDQGSQKVSRRQSRDMNVDQISSLPYIQYSDGKANRLEGSAYGQREEKMRQMKLLKIYQRGLLATQNRDRVKEAVNNESLIESPQIQLIQTQKQFFMDQQLTDSPSKIYQRDMVRANSAIKQTIQEQKSIIQQAKYSSVDKKDSKNRKDIIIYTQQKGKQKATDLLILGDDMGPIEIEGKNGQLIKIMPNSTKSSQKKLSRNGSRPEHRLDSLKQKKSKQQITQEQLKKDNLNAEKQEFNREDSKSKLQSATKNDKLQHQQNKQLDSFFKCQQIAQKGDFRQRREREIIQTFLRRNNFEGDDTIVFIFNSRDSYLKRAALKRGWIENTVQNSLIFDIKFEYTDKQNEYNILRSYQFYNHYPDGREVTTKQGLNKNINNITLPEIDIYKFYPRCYDLSDVKQIDWFNEDFNKSAILNIIRKHAKLFKRLFKEQLEEIFREDDKIGDNVFKMDNKKKLKRKYWAQFPTDEQQLELGLINIVLLQNAIFYAKNILNDINESCEGDEYIKKNFFVQRFQFNQKILDLMVIYSQLKFPVLGLEEGQRILQYINGWDFPNLYLMFLTVKIHRQLKKSIYQYRMIDDVSNIWICKPSYNARGFGIFCFNNLSEFMGGNLRKNPTPKIVQKYIEKSLLINVNEQDPKDLRKFDIRQWVLVTSYDPLKVYVYQDAYLRICGQPFDIEDINDPLKHISNYTIQKKQEGATAQELTMNVHDFIQILNKNQKHKNVKWEHFSSQIQKIVEITLRQASENIEQRSNCFELYGFDFVIDKNLNCWLIEVNMSPACAERTPWLTEMLDDMAEGMLNILEKQVLVNSPNIFYGQLAQIQEDHKQNKIEVDLKKWKYIGKKSKEIKYKSGSPMKNIQQQMMTTMINQNKNSMFMFDLIGQKVSLKQEKKLDKQFRKFISAIHIQKFWKGYLVRKSMYVQKTQSRLQEYKKRTSMQNILEILELAFSRTKKEDILNLGFQTIRFLCIEKHIGSSKENRDKIILIQRFYRKRILDKTKEVMQVYSRNTNDFEIDEAGGESIRGIKGDKRVKEMFDLKAKLSLIEEATETSQVFQSCRPVRTPIRNQRQATFDRDLLLDFASLGLHLQQDTGQFEKMMAKRSARLSPKPSPYTQGFKQFKNKSKGHRARASQEHKIKTEFQQNQTLLRTQRQLFNVTNEKKGVIKKQKKGTEQLGVKSPLKVNGKA